MAQQEVPVYGWWGEVPEHLRSLTQLRDGEFPREPGGPVRAWVQTRDWWDHKDEVPLYEVAESRPTAASARQLEAAARRRTAVVRVCGDCRVFSRIRISHETSVILKASGTLPAVDRGVGCFGTLI